jgi:CRP-like cAMP-binding protein
MTELFAMLDDPERRRIRSLMTRRRFERNEVVFHQGDLGGSLHVIESGWFLVQAVNRSGGRVGMTIEGPGDVFGELAMLRSDGRRTATIRALRRSETLCLDATTFADLRRTLPEVDRFLVILLTRRVVRLTEQLSETAWTPADKRVCREVNRLTKVFDGGPIQLKQDELASLAHTTRPTVSTVLNDLARAGIVATGRGSVTVLDPERLEARAGR